MRDLLPSIVTGSQTGSIDVESQRFPSQSSSAPRRATVMEDFFQDVSDMKYLLKDIEDSKDGLKTIHEQSRTATRKEDVDQFKSERAAISTHVKETAAKALKCLENIERKNAEFRKLPGNEVGSTNERHRTAITLGLQKKLKEQIMEFEAYQKKITDDQHQQAARQLFARTGQKPSEEMVEKVVNEGATVFNSQGFAQMEDGKGHVLDTLAEITERRDAVKQLEKSLIELHQIFLDMAVLVEAQGEELDNIEAQVARSHEYVAKGTEQLVQARELQKSSRKFMCYGIICLVVIILIVALSIAGTLSR